MSRLTVLGEPVAWARARRRGNRHFNTPAHAAHLDHLAELWETPPLEGPVEVRLRFFCGRKKSHMRTGKNAHLVRAGAPPRPRADVDNLAKLVLDALSGCAYEDDSQVVSLTATKTFGPPHTEIEVVPLAPINKRERTSETQRSG